MSDKTLFIHAGGSKTGSTSLQKFMYLNAERLETFGFAFNKFEINNGTLLYNALSSATTTDNEIDCLLLSYLGVCKNGICSSEFFQLLQSQGWCKLHESSVRLGVTLKVIMYVRNVLPFLLSSYDQAIKYHCEKRVFDQWVGECDWGHATALKTITEKLPQLNITVIHYDQVRKNLIRNFLDALGVDPIFKVDKQVQQHQVNRSLTVREREILMYVNGIYGAAYIGELSDLFIYANPNVQGEPVSYGKKTEVLLLNRFKNDVDWVNNTFFNGQSVVSVLPMKSEKKQEQSLMQKQTQNNATEKQVLGWALEKLKAIQNETECRILDSLNNAVSQNASKNYPPEIPADFDALAYLLLNRDVLHSGMDPIQHYINHGKTEGRRYRF
jgi:hypothetical protein